MANGPDRSKCLNSPSACARRSATAHNAAGLTPSPIWLAKCTSMFSAVSEGRSRLVSPVHDAVGAGIDRGRRHRQVAGDRLANLRIVVDRLARQRLVEPRGVGRPDVVGKRAAERDHGAHHVRHLQRQIARIDAAETPADEADLAAGLVVNARQAGRATPPRLEATPPRLRPMFQAWAS